MAVLLDARGAQPGKTVLVDGRLPGQILLNRQGVALTRLFKAKKTTSHGGDDFGLTANNPAPRGGRRQIVYCQRTSIWPDDIFDAWSNLVGHCTHYTLKDH